MSVSSGLEPSTFAELARLARCEDPDEVLRGLGRLAARLIGARQAVVVEHLDRDGRSRAGIHLEGPDGQAAVDPPGAAPIARLATLGVTIAASERLDPDELRADPRLASAGDQGGPPLRGYLAVPLRDDRGRVVGRLALSDPVGDEFTPEHASLLAGFADLAAAILGGRRQVDAMAEAQRQRQAFFGVVSHELRTPITTIYGGVRVLRQSSGRLSHDTRQQLMDDISQEAERLYRLVEDLLVLSRAEREALDVEAEPILLQHLLPRVVGSEQQRWPSARLRVEAGPGLPPVMGDSTLVEQVTRNYLSNAVKYAGLEGPIEVSAVASDGWVEVRVADQGPGIDLDPPDRVFELFYRAPDAPSRAQGAGIGLYVCRELIGAMGGEVWVRPNVPRGAEFGYRLRAYADGDEPAP